MRRLCSHSRFGRGEALGQKEDKMRESSPAMKSLEARASLQQASILFEQRSHRIETGESWFAMAVRHGVFQANQQKAFEEFLEGR